MLELIKALQDIKEALLKKNSEQEVSKSLLI